MQLLSVDFHGRDFHLLLTLQAGLAKAPLLSLTSPPCSGTSGLLKGQTHQEKLRKGELKGRSHIYHTSLHDTTLVHVCVSFTCPGRHAEGQEHGLQQEKRRVSEPRQPAPSAAPALALALAALGCLNRGAGDLGPKAGYPAAHGTKPGWTARGSGKVPSRFVKRCYFQIKSKVNTDSRTADYAPQMGVGQSSCPCLGPPPAGASVGAASQDDAQWSPKQESWRPLVSLGKGHTLASTTLREDAGLRCRESRARSSSLES